MNMFRPIYFPIILLALSLFSCSGKENKNSPVSNDSSEKKIKNKVAATTQTEQVKPVFSYHFVKRKDWLAQKDSFEGARHLDILTVINRVDTTHLKRLDSILVPNDFSRKPEDYLPFPNHVDLLQDVKKIVIFSYPTQTFAAYEHGNMVLTGVTNMGRKNKPTPEGLFFTNWKAKKTTSTVNDEWVLKWNFNVQNKLGVGFHEYALPGYPASHSCMRLTSSNAQFLYNWAQQWILKGDELKAPGTPVIVYGNYPFGKSKPWYQLTENPNAMTIPVDSLNAYIQPYLQTILDKQKLRETVESDMIK